MALATRCPYCHTTFRVAHDQLKLRAGLVRCGSCKEIFNGVEHLLPGSAAVPATVPPNSAIHSSATVSAPTGAVPSPSQPFPAAATVRPHQRATLDQQSADQAIQPAATAVPPAVVNEDPMLRMTLMDISAWKENDNESALPRSNSLPGSPAQAAAVYSLSEQAGQEPDELDRAMEELQRKPWRRKRSKRRDDPDVEDDEEAREPDFVLRARRQQRLGRFFRAFLGIGSVLLFIALAAQATYAFRNQIAVQLPQAVPLLTKACVPIGCDIGLPEKIEKVALESSELQILSPNQSNFVLTTVIRNRGTIPQAWPSIELTLNDINEKPIARRVFRPREYLTSAIDIRTGINANTESSIKVYFELVDLRPSGYRVYLFYP